MEGLVRQPGLHLLFLLSGAASLIYQVAWVRAFALVFGGSVPSASIVTATVLAGLGLGGWLGGHWADRHPQRVGRAWGIAELAIGTLALGIALVVPRLVPLVALFNTYTVDPSGIHELSTGTSLLRGTLVVGLLLPVTTLMGATLPLLARWLVPHAAQATLRLGLLYATGTLGAALGAALTDTLLVPWLGLWRTQLVAVGTSIGLGLAVLAASRSAVDPSPARPPAASLPLHVVAAVFLAGVAAMGLEIVWFRFLGGALGPYRAVFALLLATVLVSQAIGAALAGWLHRRWGHPALALVLTQSAVAVTALACLWWHDPTSLLRAQLGVAEAHAAGGPWIRAWLLHGVNGSAIAAVVAAPSVLMGAVFPLANSLVQDRDEAVARRAGGLYLATTLGNVAGAVSAGFWWLPGPGLQASAGFYAALCVLAGLLLASRRTVAALVPGMLALVAWAQLPAHTLVWATFPSHRLDPDDVLEVREGLEQIVVVSGREQGPARLWTNGHPMTSTTPHAQRYMRAMAHLPLLLRDRPKRALVICVGAGNTLHAVSLHPSIEQVHAVDLSRDVLAVSPWFEHANHGVLRDPRVQTFVDDGRHHLWVHPDTRYDLITLEPPPLAAAGVSSLYAAELYALARDRLAEDGLIAQWLPAYQVDAPAVRSLVGTFVDAFPHAVLLVGSGRELILVGSRAPVTLDPEAWTRRLAERPSVREDLARIGLGQLQEWALTYAADRATLVAATEGAPRITDDQPLLEGAALSHLIDTRLPPDLFAVQTLQRWCPRCDLTEGHAVTEALWRSEAFLSFSAAGGSITSQLPAPATDEETLAAITASETLTAAVLAPEALALRAQELWEAGETAAARAHLRAARQQRPGEQLFEDMERAWAEP